MCGNSVRCARSLAASVEEARGGPASERAWEAKQRCGEVKLSRTRVGVEPYSNSSDVERHLPCCQQNSDADKCQGDVEWQDESERGKSRSRR